MKERLRSVIGWLAGPGIWLVLAALIVWSVFLRTRNLASPLWIDEGISVGVAHFPFFDIPTALQQDGNPPVYYLLLNLWIRAFGDGEVAVHMLSLLFATLAIPVAYLLARKPLGKLTAVSAAAVTATLPFLTVYSQETRMYSLVALLSLVIAGLHLHVFEDGARKSRVGLALALAAILYTHSWGVFLAGGSTLAVAVRALHEPQGRRRQIIRTGALIHFAALVAWLPWLPTLFRQAKETGAPWSLSPDVSDALEAVGSIAGAPIQATICVTLIVVSIALLKTGRKFAWVLITLLLVTATLAWIGSVINPAWSNRYMAAIIGPAVLLVALAMTRSAPIMRYLLIFLLIVWGANTQGSRFAHKRTPQAMVEAVAHELKPGDLVISVQPEQVPVIAYALRKQGAPVSQLRFATALDEQKDVRIFDWRHGLDRFRAATPWRVQRKLINGQHPGSKVLLASPKVNVGNWTAPWTSLIASRVEIWSALMASDPNLKIIGRRPAVGPNQGVYGVLFQVRP